MLNYKTIGDLRKAIDEGIIDSGKLEIVLDNDCTNFYLNNGTDDPNEITVSSANGYCDIEELYNLVFPNAIVDWC
ncbi:MAG: hypothetical protein GY753_17010 [Gammaproteobacteria bacterium]|nr:hypothetical protein [Gammaproteobacteria bacterium]